MKVFVFLDYDGTLVPFKPRPEQARPTKEVLSLLKRLSRKKGFEVAIISGRSMPELEDLFPIKGISFAALHGLEVKLSSGKKILSGKASVAIPLIEKIDSASRKKFGSVKGILFQNKLYGFTFHFRNVSRKLHPRLKRSFRALVRKVDKRKALEVIPGALVLEARLLGWDKGKATNLLLKEFGFKKQDVVLFFGDDFTDEDAFRALDKKALTFLVSGENRKTKALFRLSSPKAVLRFLNSLL